VCPRAAAGRVRRPLRRAAPADVRYLPRCARHRWPPRLYKALNRMRTIPGFTTHGHATPPPHTRARVSTGGKYIERTPKGNTWQKNTVSQPTVRLPLPYNMRTHPTVLSYSPTVTLNSDITTLHGALTDSKMVRAGAHSLRLLTQNSSCRCAEPAFSTERTRIPK
jgi:hypothetical protein